MTMLAADTGAICELDDVELDAVDGGSAYTGYIALAGAGLAYGVAIAGGPVTLAALGVGIAIGALAS